ncbi:SGNH/GDSL hydrolase family protein [Streptococcus oricebi]|uniref:1-alkyl-2-acetylglycerophosphocholine esterase n=1 Tax=Streptococcus oricebi TaxID=1547447 RepID=A0ABS5B4G4_9STRE|nr:SGNH/GDSL hydrolase family protein [Streptococcus oricebi]MBP2623571.1 1-alkyl-2-acetylglycerophosphocholine esterase [Streptococcus oricebi]
MAVKLLDNWILKEQAQIQKNYEDLNALAIKEPAVIFLGDSIVEYFPLHELLKTSKVLVNRGIRAYKSYLLRQHLDSLLFGQALDKIFILIGTNDIGEDLALKESLANLEAIIQEIARDYPLTQIYLLSVLPVNEGEAYRNTVYIRTNARIQALNQAYQDLVQNYHNASFLNLYDLLLDEKGQLAADFTIDGVHLTIAGYARLAEKLRTYI